MQGLSGIRIAHCSFHCSGRSSAAAKQDLVHLGFQQTSSSFKCCRKGFTPALPMLKASLQDGAATESAQTPLGEEVSGNQAEEEAKNDGVALEEGPKVKVKFVLEKKCNFGQRFNVVGSDPLLGDWEVEAAIPMQWADGDIWTVEVNVPAEKQFEFKFVLTGESGEEVVWQPGSNRLLETVEGVSPLVVNEAWGSVDEAAAVEVGKDQDAVNDTGSTSETEGVLVPVDISCTEDAAKDEIVEALEYKDGGTGAHATPSKSDLNVAPEVPVAELDIVTTAVKSMVSVDDTV